MIDIRALRRRRTLTQAGLGTLIGVHACTVSRWERGVHHPRPVYVDRLAVLDRTRADRARDASIGTLAAARSAAAHRPRRAPRPARTDRSVPPRIAPNTPITPSASGDRWSLFHADLFDVLPTLPDSSFDALIGDLPYSSGGLHIGTRTQKPSRKYQGHSVAHKREDFDGDQRDQFSWLHWSTEVLRRCHRLLKRSAVVALFIDWRQLAALITAMQCAGFAYRGIAVWDKTEGARPVPGRFRNQCEYIVWGSKGDLPTDRKVPILPGLTREPVRAADKHHMTGKPTTVMRWLAKFVIPGGKILDPSAGSGSTGVGALLEGRHFVGIEQDATHAQRAVARLRAADRGHVLAAGDAACTFAEPSPLASP